ncbi:MAG: hypothetical protein K2L51_00140 [Clostridiales bacterium]|nr:hypothetical protein [Clostridiales bacterium]
MKRMFVAVVAILLACAACLAGCGGKKFAFPATAQEEYTRVYTLQNGKPFDFSQLATCKITQTLSVDIPSRRALRDDSGNAVFPTVEQREYLFDARTSQVRSRLTDKVAVYDLSGERAPTYEWSRKQFTDGKYYTPVMSASGEQLGDKRVPVSFGSYAEFLTDARAYDTVMQNITRYPEEMFSQISGGVGAKKKTYYIRCTVAAEQYGAFFALFAREYDLGDSNTTGNKWLDGDVYRYFIDPQNISSAQVDVATTADGLRSVTVTIKATAISTPAPVASETYGEFWGEVTVTASTEYDTAPFAAGVIVTPPLEN